MDISNITQILFNEFDANKGLLFENHLYGLFVVYQGLVEDPSSVLENAEEWSTIGIRHGFLNDDRATYEGSPAYKDIWTRILHDPSFCDIDAIEDAIFGPICLRGAVFFASALSNGTLPPVLQEIALEMLDATVSEPEPVSVSEPIVESPLKKRHRTRGRIHSPILRKGKFTKTRKAVHFA